MFTSCVDLVRFKAALNLKWTGTCCTHSTGVVNESTGVKAEDSARGLNLGERWTRTR